MPRSAEHLQDRAGAGLDYDSTLSYADCADCSCGICYECPVFTLIASMCFGTFANDR